MTGAVQHLSPPLRRQAAAAAALGLMAGVGFIVPVLAYHGMSPGRSRTVLLVLAAIVAILLVRNAGRRLLPVLDATPRRWRIVLLGLYGLTAMAFAALVLLR